MRKIILVGGNGFIGEYLYKLLIKRRDAKVQILDRSNFSDSIFYKEAEAVVILTPPSREVIQKIVSAIETSKKLKKIIYLSTILLYTDSILKHSEKDAVVPKSSYEKNKYQEELFISKVSKKAGYGLSIARLANVYGDIKNKGVINKLLVAVIKGKGNLTIQGDPNLKIRDYIFVEDAVKLLELLIFANQQKQIEVFNICSGKGITIKQVIDKMEKITKKKINVKIGKPILGEKRVIGKNNKILQLSGYELKYNFTDGLKKTYQNYLKAYLL